MAERRMFAKTIIRSDAFLEMPYSTQCLYFQLNSEADDEGFVNNPKSTMRVVKCNEDDLRTLASKKFIIPFESGVIVIKHWKIHNYIRGDRIHETKYQEEKSALGFDENLSYRLLNECLPDVNQLSDNCHTEVRLGKDRLGKVNKEKNTPLKDIISGSDFSESVKQKLIEWVDYKTEKKDSYVESGFNKLLAVISKKITEHGEAEVLSLIDDCMSNNWKGIIWDKLKKDKPKGSDFSLW